DVFARAHIEALLVVGQIQYLAAVEGIVKGRLPAEVIGFDGLRAKEHFDTAVAEFTDIDHRLLIPGGIGNIHREDFVDGQLVVCGNVEANPVVEEAYVEPNFGFFYRKWPEVAIRAPVARNDTKRRAVELVGFDV